MALVRLQIFRESFFHLFLNYIVEGDVSDPADKLVLVANALIFLETAVLPDHARLRVNGLRQLVKRLLLLVFDFEVIALSINQFLEVCLAETVLICRLNSVLFVEHRNVERVSEFSVHAHGVPLFLFNLLGVRLVVLRRVVSGGDQHAMSV